MKDCFVPIYQFFDSPHVIFLSQAILIKFVRKNLSNGTCNKTANPGNIG